jgi:acyl-CoA synthetase (NDP forming)
VPVSNPLDITAQGLSEPSIYTRTLEALLEDDRVGTVLAGIIQAEPITCAIKYPPILAAVDGKTLTKPLVFAGLDEGADVPAERIAALRAAGIPWFPTTERALRAIARLTHWSARDLSATDKPPRRWRAGRGFGRGAGIQGQGTAGAAGLAVPPAVSRRARTRRSRPPTRSAIRWR